MSHFLEISGLLETIQNIQIRRTCHILKADDRFWESPGSCVKHQAYSGGLADHTYQVMQLAIAAALAPPIREYVNFDILIASTFAHDFGKIWDYQQIQNRKNVDPSHGYTRHRWTVRHLVRSYHEWMKAAEMSLLEDDLAEEVSHVILAHHGRNEWGSPVEPLTLEAMLLHQADLLSARFVEKIDQTPFRQVNRIDWSKLEPIVDK